MHNIRVIAVGLVLSAATISKVASQDARPSATTTQASSSPLPDATNTGPAAAGYMHLIPTEGESIQADGALPSWAALQSDGWVLIEGRSFTKPFQIYRDKVRIRGCSAIGSWPDGPFWYGRAKTGLTIEYCEAHAPRGDNTIPAAKLQYIVAAVPDNLIIRNCNFYWWSDAVALGGGESNVVIENNWVHDPVFYEKDHIDCIQHYGGGKNVIIRNNRLENNINQTSCIALFQDGHPGSNAYDGVQILNNLCAGGGYVFYCGSGHDPIRNIEFKNNRISTKYWPQGGNFGVKAAAPIWGKDGNSWDGNIWEDGPAAGKEIP